MRQPNGEMDTSIIRIWFIASVIFIIAAAASIYVTLWDTQVWPRYDLIKDESSYQLDVRLWTGTDEHSMRLQSGEKLHIEWRLQVGVIDVSVAIQENTPIYTANRVNFKDNPDVTFDVMIPESGDYLICISVKEATGTIGVMKS